MEGEKQRSYDEIKEECYELLREVWKIEFNKLI